VLRLNGDQILHLHDAGGTPGRALGFLALGPRAHTPAQNGFRALGFDGDPLGIQLGAAPQRLLSNASG
jgi:hypothetical protein